MREDIRLLPARASRNGAPQWAIFDPLLHQYFLIGPEAFDILSAWPEARDAGEAAALAERRSGLPTTVEDVEALARFLAHHQLLDLSRAGAPPAPRVGWLRRLAHNYLFFKVPLLRPERFLRATLPFARLLASRPALALYAALSLIGLFLASRRWGQFVATFNDFWTPSGAVVFAAALLGLKLLHEFGHAYVATAKGCRVSSMGVVFMIGAPMPYTDVTDAWKLTRRRDRMAIDIAGVAVEFVVAGLATFAWVFLPDGDARAIAFVLASTAWAISLIVNLNPLMRFDGYFILADAVNVPNLQPRSFAIGKWALRTTLFGLDESAPDNEPPATRRLMALYAYAVWIYRLIVFTGIALIVYHMFFKALGVLLFLVEVGLLIVMPIWRELKVWGRSRRAILTSRRTALTMLAAASLAALLFYPLSASITVPVVLEPGNFARVFPRTQGEVIRVLARPGEKVQAGATLVELDSPRLRHYIAQSRRRLELVETRLARRVADRKDLAATLQLEREREELLAKLDALARDADGLIVRTPIAGVVADFNPAIHVGRAVARADEIALVVGEGGLATRGYARSEDLARIAPGAAGDFLPESLIEEKLPVTFARAATTGARSIEIPVLASAFGGPVETWPASKAGEIAPLHARYLVEFALSGPQAQALRAEALGPLRRGVVRVDATPESLAAAVWRHILRVLVQEAGA
ncbi:MAG: hypothetical protein JNK46_14855 [Methylobacteriaceae bacterium]|nr:hypothetical protein [Methylobacteriaceae bacterium]